MATSKILVIDDDSAVRSIICDSLIECGYEIRSARDGEEGLLMISQGYHPQIVISDIIMPRKEGIETIIELKKNLPEIKVIAISGGGRTKAEDFLQLARKLGASASVEKPIDMDHLEQVIAELLSNG